MPNQAKHFSDNTFFVTRRSLGASESYRICFRNGHVHCHQAVLGFIHAVRQRMIRDNAGIVNSGLWFVVTVAQRLRQIIKSIRHFRIIRILGHDFFISTNRGRIGPSEVIKICDPVHTFGEHFLDSPQLLLCLVEKRTIGIMFDQGFQFRLGQ